MDTIARNVSSLFQRPKTQYINIEHLCSTFLCAILYIQYHLMYEKCCDLQTLLLAMLMKRFGNKRTVLFGLLFEMLQLFMIGFGCTPW